MICFIRQENLNVLTSERLALRGRVTGAVGSEAGVARGVGKLDYREQRQHPGPRGDEGGGGGVMEQHGGEA